MCIIISIKRNQELPADEILRICAEANPDGGGYAIQTQTNVKIMKGYFDTEKLIQDLKKDRQQNPHSAVIIHFRITTHGGTCKELCHPFPLTNDSKKLGLKHIYTPVALAHNGIIPRGISPEGFSDTTAYISKELYPISKAVKDWYKNTDILNSIQARIQSKLAILLKTGDPILIGDFIEEDGIFYSNSSYVYQSPGYKTPTTCYTYTQDYYEEWPNDDPMTLGLKRLDSGFLYSYQTDDYIVIDEDYEYEYYIDTCGTVVRYDYVTDDYYDLDDFEAFTVDGSPVAVSS